LWFGFQVNKDLYNIFKYTNTSYKYIDYKEEDCIKNDIIKKEMFMILLRFCGITGSRQLLRFVNEYGNKVNTKGNDRFFDTFGVFYDYKNKDNKQVTIECCSYLNRLFKINSHKKAFKTIKQIVID